MNWQDILTIIVPLSGFLAWVYSRIDKRFDEIKIEMKANFEKIDDRFTKIDDRFNRIDERFNRIDKDINQLNTRVAVIESKISDLNTNISYLMWQHQAPPPPKEAHE